MLVAPLAELPIAIAIRCAGFMGYSVTIAILFVDEINIGVVTAFAPRTCADGKKDRVAIAAVHEMMAVRDAGLEAGGLTGPNDGLAVILDQHQFAFDHVDELVLLFVPMPCRRRGARLEAEQIDTELGQVCAVAERLPFPAIDDPVE